MKYSTFILTLIVFALVLIVILQMQNSRMSLVYHNVTQNQKIVITATIDNSKAETVIEKITGSGNVVGERNNVENKLSDGKI